MKEKVKKIITAIFGTQNNILNKINCSFLLTGILLLLITLTIEDKNSQAYKIFMGSSSLFMGIWLSFISGNASIKEFLKEFARLIIFFSILICSLNFCLNISNDLTGFELIIGSILSCCGIFFCSFYLSSKFFDIFTFIKNMLIQIRNKLFNNSQPSTSNVKALIENITAFLVAIAGLGVAIKAIIEPLFNLFK